jgi:hypothetical protein
MFNSYKKILFIITVLILCTFHRAFASIDFIQFVNVCSEENFVCLDDESDDTYQEPEQNEDSVDDSVQPPDDTPVDQDNSESE